MTEPVGNNPRDITIPNNSLSGTPPPTPKPGPKKAGSDPIEPPKDQRELSKIVEGKVVVHKQSWWKRAARSMIADDATSVGDYLITDVIVPAAKRLIADIVQSSTDRVLFGTTSRRRGFGGLRDERAPSIRNRYDRLPEEPRGISREARARHDFTDVSLDNRQEAIDVVDELVDYIREYGAVSVAQLYTLLGVTGSYADQRWGWTDLTTADVKQGRRGGWIVDLPAPEPLR